MAVNGERKRGRVLLWTSHRCVSTAFARSMGQIPGMEVWYESFAFAYNAALNLKANDGTDLPMVYEGNEGLFEKAAQYFSKVQSREFPPDYLSYDNLRRKMEDSHAEHVFLKDMGIAMQTDSQRQCMPKGYRHSFLIRHPLLMYASLHKANYIHVKNSNQLHADEIDEGSFDLRKHIELDDPALYFSCLHALWKHVTENIDPAAIIVDSSDLLASPSTIVPKYCEAVGLPFRQNMIAWEPSLDDFSSWKCVPNFNDHKAYFDKLLSTTGFSRPQEIPSRDTLTPDVLELADAAMPFYEEMFSNRLQ